MRVCSLSGIDDLNDDLSAVSWLVSNICTGVLPVCCMYLRDDISEITGFIKKHYPKKITGSRHRVTCEIDGTKVPVTYETPSSWAFDYEDVSMVLISTEKTVHIYCPDPVMTRDFNRPDTMSYTFSRNDEISRLDDDEVLALYETVYEDVCSDYSRDKTYYDESDPDCPYISADEDTDMDKNLFDTEAYLSPSADIDMPDKEAHTYNGILYISNGDGTCTAAENLSVKRKSVLIPEVSPEGDTVTAIADESFNDFIHIRLPETVQKVGRHSVWSWYVNKPRDFIPDGEYHGFG